MNILLPTDGSAQALNAARHIIKYAKNMAAKIIVLSVVPESAMQALYLSEASRIQTELYEEAWKSVKQTAEVLQSAGIKIETEVKQGIVWKEILDSAAEHGVDLIVLGCRPRSRMETGVVGSVSDLVLKEAICPILVVRWGGETPPTR